MEKNEEIAWIAGIFEGEGWAGIENNTYMRKNKLKHVYPVVRIVNTEEELIIPCKKYFDGSITKRYPKPNTLSKKVQFIWTITCRKAEQFAIQILPYIKGNKREKLLEIIDFYKRKQKYVFSKYKGI